MRAMRSLPPPAAADTTKRTLRLGYCAAVSACCAKAPAPVRAMATSAPNVREMMLVMFPPAAISRSLAWKDLCHGERLWGRGRWLRAATLPRCGEKESETDDGLRGPNGVRSPSPALARERRPAGQGSGGGLQLFPQPPPVGVTMVTASPGDTFVDAQPGKLFDAPVSRGARGCARFARLAARCAEGAHAPAARQDRKLHVFQKADRAADAVARIETCPCRPSRAGRENPPARRGSAAPALRGR